MVKSYVNELNHEAKFIECDKSDKGYRILGKLSVPFFDMNGPTRNGRNYSEAAEEALNSDNFKELMNNRCFFGRLGHPMTEDESAEDPAVRACVVMSDYHKNDKTNMYEATLDILDNQYGKQLKSLVDAGCRLGASTRGSGDSYEDASGNEMIRDYEFENLDIVTLPAVKAARVTVVESLDKNKRKKLEEVINDSNDKYVLESLKVTIESSNMPNKKELLESIDKKLSGGVKTIESLVNDIAMLTNKLEESESKLSEANIKLQKYESSSETIGIDKQKVTESINKLTKILQSNNIVINDMKNESVEKDGKINSLTESLKKANGNTEKVTEKLESLTSENETLKSDKVKLENLNKELNEKLNSTKSLNESLSKAKAEDNGKLKESLSKSNDTISKLKESNSNWNKAYNSLLSKYVESVATSYGIDVSELKSKINSKSTPVMIESAAKSIRDSKDTYKMAMGDVLSLGRPVMNESKISIKDPELDRAGRMAQALSQNR